MGKQNVILCRWVGVDAEMVLAMVGKEAVPTNLLCPLSANLLLDSVQKFLSMRGENDLLGIEQTAFKEGTPDAISVLIIDRVDDIVEDNDRAVLCEIFRQKNRKTQAPDMPFAQDQQGIKSLTWLTYELNFDFPIFSQRQP